MSARGYRTKHERVAVAGVDDLLIRSLLDRREFFDPAGQAERLGISSAAWPLFGLCWPSEAILAARLAGRPVRAQERILELGCGLAVASLVGHRRGADVTASDCHPLAEAFLLENLRLNGLLPMKYRHGRWGGVHGAWPGAPSRGPPVAAPVAAYPYSYLDPMAAAVVAGRYDLVIGSDLLYERDERGALAGFIDRHVAPGGEVWVVDPDRSNRAAFHRCMAARGFGVTEERIAGVAAPAPGGRAYKGRLLVYRRVPFDAPGGPQ
jgi:predicted nicotinamide N-methyase